MKPTHLVLGIALAAALCTTAAADELQSIATGETTMTHDETEDLSKKDESYWKEKLSPEQYHVCREGGTERPFTGKFYRSHDKGTYVCSACGAQLFSSDTKFESGTGWPSFFDPINAKSVSLHTDSTHGMTRTEVRCAKCQAHLGHVFNDGPNPTGKRYCINSISLDLKKAEAK